MKVLSAIMIAGALFASPIVASAGITDKDQAQYDRCQRAAKNHDTDTVISRCSDCAHYLMNRMDQETDFNTAIVIKLFAAYCFALEGVAEKYEGEDTAAQEHLLTADVGVKAIMRDSDNPAILAKAKQLMALIENE